MGQRVSRAAWHCCWIGVGAFIWLEAVGCQGPEGIGGQDGDSVPGAPSNGSGLFDDLHAGLEVVQEGIESARDGFESMKLPGGGLGPSISTPGTQSGSGEGVPDPAPSLTDRAFSDADLSALLVSVPVPVEADFIRQSPVRGYSFAEYSVAEASTSGSVALRTRLEHDLSVREEIRYWLANWFASNVGGGDIGAAEEIWAATVMSRSYDLADSFIRSSSSHSARYRQFVHLGLEASRAGDEPAAAFFLARAEAIRAERPIEGPSGHQGWGLAEAYLRIGDTNQWLEHSHIKEWNDPRAVSVKGFKVPENAARNVHVHEIYSRVAERIYSNEALPWGTRMGILHSKVWCDVQAGFEREDFPWLVGEFLQAEHPEMTPVSSHQDPSRYPEEGNLWMKGRVPALVTLAIRRFVRTGDDTDVQTCLNLFDSQVEEGAIEPHRVAEFREKYVRGIAGCYALFGRPADGLAVVQRLAMETGYADDVVTCPGLPTLVAVADCAIRTDDEASEQAVIEMITKCVQYGEDHEGVFTCGGGVKGPTESALIRVAAAYVASGRDSDALGLPDRLGIQLEDARLRSGQLSACFEAIRSDGNRDLAMACPPCFARDLLRVRGDTEGIVELEAGINANMSALGDFVEAHFSIQGRGAALAAYQATGGQIPRTSSPIPHDFNVRRPWQLGGFEVFAHDEKREFTYFLLELAEAREAAGLQ